MAQTKAVDPRSPQMKLIDQFLKRRNAAQGVSDLWMALHRACYFYAIPQRNRYWLPRETQGDMRGSRVYDTTAIEGVNIFVSKLQTAMVPPQTQWGFLKLRGEWDTQNTMTKEQAQQVLDDYMKKLFDYIHASNFDVAMNECLYDLAIGTSCLVINSVDDETPLMFTSVPMDVLAIEEAANGKIESWYRSWEITKINEITGRWPKAVIPAEYAAMAAEDPGATISKIFEGVMYVPKEEKPYCYVVCTESYILFKEYFDINPGIVWRFKKVNKDVYGRGPIMDALPSIISLNELARIELASANLNVFKPYMAFSDSVFNPHTFTMQPMSIIPIAPLGTQGQVPLIPLPDTSNPNFAQLTVMDLRKQINSLLYADSPVMNDGGVQPTTAAEQMIYKQSIAEKIGPTFSRLQQEFLWPLINRVMYILDKMGLLPIPKFGKNKIDFSYRSPLALAKGQEQISRFIQFSQILQGLSGPEMTQVYLNSQTYPYILANYMQIDKELLNEPEQVAQVMQNMQNQMNQYQDQMEESGQTPELTQG